MPEHRAAFSESGTPDWSADFAAKLVLIERRFLDAESVVEETV